MTRCTRLSRKDICVSSKLKTDDEFDEPRDVISRESTHGAWFMDVLPKTTIYGNGKPVQDGIPTKPLSHLHV